MVSFHIGCWIKDAPSLRAVGIGSRQEWQSFPQGGSSHSTDQNKLSSVFLAYLLALHQRFGGNDSLHSSGTGRQLEYALGIVNIVGGIVNQSPIDIAKDNLNLLTGG